MSGGSTAIFKGLHGVPVNVNQDIIISPTQKSISLFPSPKIYFCNVEELVLGVSKDGSSVDALLDVIGNPN